MMGEVVGMAASICKKHHSIPRGVYTDHLDRLKAMMVGEDMTKWLENAAPNLAREAKVSVSSNYDVNKYPKENINDGRFDIKDNRHRWVSSASEWPDHITFSWSQPHTISAVRVISGWFDGKVSKDPIGRFTLQVDHQGKWKDIRGLRIMRNAPVESITTFQPVKSDRIRMVITDTPGKISRIWEVEFYHPTTTGEANERIK
jgi:hypothetical protein